MTDTAEIDVDLAKATRLVRLALVVLVVAVLVLAIDYRLKNFIIKEGQKALTLLDRAQFYAEGSGHGETRSDSGGAVDGDPVGAPDGVGDDAGARADVGPVANGRGPAQGSRPARTGRGTPGHGGRAGGAA